MLRNEAEPREGDLRPVAERVRLILFGFSPNQFNPFTRPAGEGHPDPSRKSPHPWAHQDSRIQYSFPNIP